MNVYDLMAKLSLDDSEYTKGLNAAESKASSFSSSVVGKIGGGLKTAAKVGAVAIGTAATAIGALTAKAVDSYAEFEQLEGGVKKLYGSAADTLMNYANQAYKTSGMSANQYMEQATSFSAALINSLGGDVQKAAEQTDVAMRAISDNVNTFGTDMESVQNAFQGFAKQNYTMLDNLKLGYGGTKEGMTQLIADANEYAKSIGQAGDLSIDSFSDIVTAIELVQEKQGVAGTTAKEAASTISGSLEMTKAAWENLVAGFANPDADIGELISQFAESASLAFDNLLPAIGQALEGIGQFITDAFPKIMEMLPEALEQGLPMLLDAAFNMVASIVETLPDMFTAIVDTLPELWETIKTYFEELGPEVMKAGQDLIDKLIEGFSADRGEDISAGTDIITGFIENLLEGLPDVVNTGLEIISALLEGITDNLDEIITSAGEIISSLAEGILDAIPDIANTAVDVVMGFVDGLIENLPSIAEAAVEAVTSFAETILENAPELISSGVEVLQNLITGIGDAIPNLIAKIPKIVETIWNGLQSVDWLSLGKTVIETIINGLLSLTGTVLSTMKTIATSAIDTFKSVNWGAVGKTVLTTLVNGLLGVISLVGTALKTIAQAGINAFKNSKWFALGKNVIDGIINGLKSAGSKIKETLVDLAEGALNAAKDFLGIKSPSRVFRDVIGKNIALGVAAGIEAKKGEAIKKAEELASASLQYAQKALDNYKVYHKMSLKDEMEYWDDIRKQIKKGTQARIDADKEYFAARDSYKAEQKEEKDRQKEAKQKAKEITKEYLADYKAIAKQRDNDLDDLMKKFNEDVANKASAFNKQIAKMTKARDEKLTNLYTDYLDDVKKNEDALAAEIQKINDDLAKDIDAAWENYNNSVKSRANSIMNMTGLFERVSYDKTYSKEYLQEVLTEQVGALKDYDSELTKLSDKLGNDNPLYQELQDMGVSSLYTLKEINSMSDEELKAYSDMYAEKSKVANERAVKDSQQLYKQTQDEVARLKEAASTAITEAQTAAAEISATLLQTYEDQRTKIIEEAEADMDEVRAEYSEDVAELIKERDEKAEEIRSKASEDMKKLTKQYKKDIKALAASVKEESKSVGEAMVKGMKAGIKSLASELAAEARKQAKAALQAVKDELDIKSPSKKFMWVGQMVDEGFAKGIKDSMGVVENALDNMVKIPDVKIDGNYSSNNDSKYTSGGFVQNLTINSPEALLPSEIARQTRLANQQMVLALRGV